MGLQEIDRNCKTRDSPNAFSYINDESTEREMSRTTPFKIASKNKIFGNQSNKRDKRPLQWKLQNTKQRNFEDLRKWKDLPCYWIGRINIVKNGPTTKSAIQI